MFKSKIQPPEMHRDWQQAVTEEVDGQLSNFPTLVTEPWRIQALLEEESILQRYRLCFAINLVRVLVTAITLVIFLAIEQYDSVLIVIMVSYLLLVIGLQLSLSRHREQIYRYSVAIALLDVALLGYFTYVSSTQLALSFLFLSVVLSAMLLPLGRLLLVLLFAEIVIFLGWLGLSGTMISSLFTTSFSSGVVYLKDLIIANRDNGFIILVLGLFLLALMVNRLANWSFHNDVKAQFRQKQMRQVLSFNRAVIEHLKSGVIVIGANARIFSLNRRAVELLNLNRTTAVRELKDLSPELFKRYQHWMRTAIDSQEPYRHHDEAEEVFITFSGFGDSEQRNVVMMTLESVNETLQQTQEAKLAALGRLTAGVAHEIRNPLSSINSAAQLLAETSKELTHQKLSDVVLKNVKRTNQIIADILGLFKDTRAERQILPAYETLTRFCQEFLAANTDKSFKLRLVTQEKIPLYFLFDVGQLEQVLWNLLQNSLKYAAVSDLRITLRYSLSQSRRNIYLDVMDNGVGIDEKALPRIFEPFYTGGAGSGLGLYLVRELCSANNANIIYLPVKNAVKAAVSAQPDAESIAEPKVGGACFRITVQAYFSKNIKPKD